MTKKLILSTISACILALGISAGAATVTKVVVSDFDKSLVTVTGTLTAAETGTDIYVERVTDSRGPITDGKNYATGAGANIIIQPATVTEAEDGTKTFTATFKFNAPGVDDSSNAGVDYNVYAANSTAYTFKFIDKASVYTFVDNLAGRLVSADSMYSELVKYGPSIGADASFASSRQEYLAKNMIEYSTRIASAGGVGTTARINAARDIIDLTQAELEFMAALPSARVAANVNALIQAYATSAEIDVTAYNTFTDTQKMQVCNKFIQKSYTDMRNFRIDWAAAITDAQGGGGQLGGQVLGQQGDGALGGGGSAPSPSQPSGVNTTGSAILGKYKDVVSAEWAVEAIEYVVSNGIMQGTSQDTFEPNTNVTREQVAKIISIAFDTYNPNAKSPFKDVPADHWSASYVGAAYESGLLTGKSETDFGLGEQMSREDLCTVMYRAATKMGYEFAAENSSFADIESVSSYAQDAVKKLAGAKIISGMGDGVLAPKGTATRAQTAQMLMKLAALVK